MATFKRSSRVACSICIRVIKWIPVLIIFAVIGWSYYVYVIKLCIFIMGSPTERAVSLLLYHILLVMVLWSYYQTVMTHVGQVPEQFYLSAADRRQLSNGRLEFYTVLGQHVTSRRLPIHSRHRLGYRRYCRWCCLLKPDRCQHCRACNTCVLKKDHHCPWMNNCIGFGNYKFFLLFLGYTVVYCQYVVVTSFHYVASASLQADLEVRSDLHIKALFFGSVVLGASLAVFLSFHCYLVLGNRTTHEFIWPPKFDFSKNIHAYSRTRYANFCEVFGDSKLRWFLPVFTSTGDGVTFYVSPFLVRDVDPIVTSSAATVDVSASDISLENGGGSDGLDVRELKDSPRSEESSDQEHTAGRSDGADWPLAAGRQLMEEEDECCHHPGGMTASVSVPAIYLGCTGPD